MLRIAAIVLLLAGALGVFAPPSLWVKPRGLLQASFGDVEALIAELRAPFRVNAQGSDVPGFVDVPAGSVGERMIADWIEGLDRSGWRYTLISYVPEYTIEGTGFDLMLLKSGSVVVNATDGMWPDGQFIASMDMESPEYTAVASMIDELCPGAERGLGGGR